MFGARVAGQGVHVFAWQAGTVEEEPNRKQNWILINVMEWYLSQMNSYLLSKQLSTYMIIAVESHYDTVQHNMIIQTVKRCQR